MANDVKSGIGYLIPASGVVGFVIALILGEFLASILITVKGILVWFLYMLVMESTIPSSVCFSQVSLKFSARYLTRAIAAACRKHDTNMKLLVPFTLR